MNQLRDFMDIVEAGSIRGAARRRGVSQPVLTKALRSLESVMGTRLAHRTAQGVVLTPAGRKFLVRASAIQAQVAKAHEEIAAIEGHGGASVAFGISAAALVLVADALDRFRDEYPNSYVRVVEGSARALLPHLRDETIDFFIGPRPQHPLDSQIRTRPLFRLPLVVAGRRGHPMAHAHSLAELAAAPWVLFSAGGWDESLLGAAFRAAGLGQPSSVTQCESYAAAIALLSTTDCLGIIPGQHLLHHGLRESVQQIRVRDPLPDVSYVLYMRSDNALTQPAAMLMRTLCIGARDMMSGARRPHRRAA